jgi:hypothetical protein
MFNETVAVGCKVCFYVTAGREPFGIHDEILLWYSMQLGIDRDLDFYPTRTFASMATFYTAYSVSATREFARVVL